MLVKTLYNEIIYIDRKTIVKAKVSMLKATYKPNGAEEKPKEIHFLDIETSNGESFVVVETMVKNEDGIFKATNPESMLSMIEFGGTIENAREIFGNSLGE